MACLAGARQYDHFGLAPLPIVSSGSRLAICCAELGEFPQGLAYGEEALQIAEAAGHTVSLIQACRGLGVLYLQRGDFAQAIPLLERSLALSRDAGLAFELHVAASSLGSAYEGSGRLTEALPLLEQAVEQATSMARAVQQSLWLVRLGEGYLLAGRQHDALPLAQGAVVLARTHQEHGAEACALRLLGALAASGAASDVAEAETYYRQAMTRARDLGMRPLLAHSALGLGTLYQHTGQRVEAHAMLSTALARCAAMGMTSWETHARTILS
jgi:tetratricopeptide (TPR) repeat protein